MSTTTDQMQLTQILQMVQEIRTELQGNRLFHVLEIVRDQVDRLSHEHEMIRNDLREIMRILATPVSD